MSSLYSKFLKNSSYCYYSTEIPTEFDLYAILGIKPSSTHSEIKQAFYLKSKLYHPDVSNEKTSSDIYEKVCKAYEILSNPTVRRNYDRKLFKPHDMTMEDSLKYKYHVYPREEILNKDAYTAKMSSYWINNKLEENRKAVLRSDIIKSQYLQVILIVLMGFCFVTFLHDRYYLNPSIVPKTSKDK